MDAPPGPSLTFLGATGTVTGSRYLVEADGQRILVDCGLFQGFKQLRLRNWSPFPVSPSSIHAVVLTHAHIDHSGYLPALVRNGFRGEIYCTPATADLCRLLLPDSAHLQEEEARFAAQRGFSRHRQPQPLYTREDAEAAIGRLQEIDFDIEQKLGGGISAKLIPAGHLLGAAQVRLSVSARTIHFSGDVGRPNDSIVRPPRAFSGANILVCESTYGDRIHPPVDAEAELAQVIGRVARRGGVVIVPAFAVGRAQAIMLQIARLKARGSIPDVPVFLNSPMAIDATAIYHEYHGEHHISDEDCRSMYAGAQRIRTVEESKELNRRSGPFVVISASGMLTGGRVLHHIVSFGSDARNAIVLSGFQAGGTRGAALAAGERSLRIFGQEVAINAEVVQIDGLSGHADANELMAWLRNGSAPEMTYVTHGEPASADALRFRIDHELGWRVRVPEHLERIDVGHPQ